MCHRVQPVFGTVIAFFVSNTAAARGWLTAHFALLPRQNTKDFTCTTPVYLHRLKRGKVTMNSLSLW
jgi:hypothetical protein